MAVLVITCSSSPARAQSKPVGAPNRAEILLLGTAGGPPLRLERSEPSTLLIVDGRSYLIDCGIGTMRRMVEAGIASENVKTIFFTHLHADHDLGLADVMGNDFLRLDALRLNAVGSEQTVNIYGPPQTKDLVDAAFHYITFGFTAFAAGSEVARPELVNGKLSDPFVAHEISSDGLFYQDDKIRVTAAENTHYALMPAQYRQQIKSFSYRIETPHGAIVFTGDTGPSDALARLAKGADVLVAEASYRDPADLDRLINSMATQNSWSPSRIKQFRAHFEFQHLDAKAIGELASKAQVKSVVLYHYGPKDKADQAAYVSGVKTYFPGPVFAPADLDRYCLGSTDGGMRDNRTIVSFCRDNPDKP